MVRLLVLLGLILATPVAAQELQTTCVSKNIADCAAYPCTFPSATGKDFTNFNRVFSVVLDGGGTYSIDLQGSNLGSGFLGVVAQTNPGPAATPAPITADIITNLHPAGLAAVRGIIQSCTTCSGTISICGSK